MIENEHTERYISLLRKPSQNSDPRNVFSVRFLVYPQFVWTHSLVCLFIFWVFLSFSMRPHSFDVLYRDVMSLSPDDRKWT
jgi:hypothetical protein